MRADSFAGQVITVFSRRAPAFQPREGEPSTFAGAALYRRKQLVRPGSVVRKVYAARWSVLDALASRSARLRTIGLQFVLIVLIAPVLAFSTYVSIGERRPWLLALTIAVSAGGVSLMSLRSSAAHGPIKKMKKKKKKKK
jgi:hypothetical protein